MSLNQAFMDFALKEAPQFVSQLLDLGQRFVKQQHGSAPLPTAPANGPMNVLDDDGSGGGTEPLKTVGISDELHDALMVKIARGMIDDKARAELSAFISGVMFAS